MTRFNLDIFDTITLLFSWYIKPLFLNESLFTSSQFVILSILLTIIIILTKSIYILLSPILLIFSTLKLTSYLSIFMGLKFILLIGLLIVVRGGIPRYRYDFLTKLG
jgi:NADH:ubiquinone oxidoreductase subunit H